MTSPFERLLAERNQYPDRAIEIDDEIRALYEQTVAILTMDMSGFSRSTVHHGIIHFLAMIHQMRSGAIPAITGNGGKVIKFEADNVFATFPTVDQAVEASKDMVRAFNAMNAVLPDERHIFGSFGIGYGKTLIVDGEDLFGEEMNTACKLGEDLAEPSEVLITDAAKNMLNPKYRLIPKTVMIGGMEIPCWRLT